MSDQPNKSDWLCFERSFILTFSLLFIAVPIGLWWHYRASAPDWHEAVWHIFFLVLGMGIVQFILGLFASSGRVQGWFASFDLESSIFLGLLTLPLHFFLKLFFRSDD